MKLATELWLFLTRASADTVGVVNDTITNVNFKDNAKTTKVTPRVKF
jgi:hypothetical protein